VKFDAASEPGTNYVQIERTAADAWTITAASTDVARLFKRGGKGGPKKRVDIGDYSMPTQFTLIVRSE